MQPTIVYGRSCEELPSRPLRGPRPHVLAAYTGPAGGLTSVNRGGHPPLQRDEADLDYIDADDATSDAQPNAYVTSQKPPPRKTPYYDLAAYFRKREPEAKGRGGDGEGGVRGGGSDDSLDCEAPSWRGEAPSPLSPNPGRAPPSAFLQFGDGPLNYGLRLPRGEDGCCLNGVGAGSGGGDGSDAGSGGGSDGDGGNGAYSNTGRCWQGDAGGEAVLVSCTDEGGGVVVNQLLEPQLDQNLNPLITLHTAVLDNNHHHQTTDVNTNDNAHTHDNHTDHQQLDDNHTDVQPDDNHPTSALYENGNYTAEENPVDGNGEAEDGEDASTLEEDSEGGNSLASQRARFLTLDLVEAGLLAGQSPSKPQPPQQSPLHQGRATSQAALARMKLFFSQPSLFRSPRPFKSDSSPAALKACWSIYALIYFTRIQCTILIRHGNLKEGPRGLDNETREYTRVSLVFRT